MTPSVRTRVQPRLATSTATIVTTRWPKKSDPTKTAQSQGTPGAIVTNLADVSARTNAAACTAINSASPPSRSRHNARLKNSHQMNTSNVPIVNDPIIE